jgi:hypothetical protein
MLLKSQLNLYVDGETDERFRAAATAAGHGRRPSPFLTQLLDVYEGDLVAIEKAIDRALAANPKLLANHQVRAQAAAITHKLARAAGNTPLA